MVIFHSYVKLPEGMYLQKSKGIESVNGYQQILTTVYIIHRKYTSTNGCYRIPNLKHVGSLDHWIQSQKLATWKMSGKINPMIVPSINYIHLYPIKSYECIIFYIILYYIIYHIILYYIILYYIISYYIISYYIILYHIILYYIILYYIILYHIILYYIILYFIIYYYNIILYFIILYFFNTILYYIVLYYVCYICVQIML